MGNESLPYWTYHITPWFSAKETGGAFHILKGHWALPQPFFCCPPETHAYYLFNFLTVAFVIDDLIES